MSAKAFLSESKGLLIAPAGFGKTHFIANAFEHVTGRYLILTHTHAGVASIKSKLAKNRIGNDRWSVETISSLTQRLTVSFYTAGPLPEQDDKAYFPFVQEQAEKLLERKHISQIIRDTYKGLFVDEYQDCTLSQHRFIRKLSELVPTYLFGDHLQGIFEFKEPLVDLSCSIQMDGFIQNRIELQEPSRWIHGGNLELGANISSIRRLLENQKEINLRDYGAIRTIVGKPESLYQQKAEIRNEIWKLMNDDSVLVLHPSSESIEPRKKFVTQFQNRFHLLESIDDGAFYNLAKTVDCPASGNPLSGTHRALVELFGSSKVSAWIKEDRLVKKTKEAATLFQILQEKFQRHTAETNSRFFKEVIDIFENRLGFSCYRKEILWAIKDAIDISLEGGISVFEAMKLNRNKVRRAGRSVKGRSIGTTLLTKGLEFNTVLVLNCQNIRCPKNFYVAISRACTQLVLFTDRHVLTPYKN